MIKKLLEFFLVNKAVVLVTFVLICLWGAMNLASLPIDAVPDITNVQVMINTKTGALDPERIEKTVTAVVETEMSGLPGLEDIRSLSKYGLSQVTLVFRDGTDLFFLRAQVAQRLQSLEGQLPAGVAPELAPITTGLGEVVMYTVNAKAGSELARKTKRERLLYLRTVQDYIVRPELKKVRGVADIDSSGGFRKEIHVNADLAAMERYGITFDHLQKKLRSVGDNYGGGFIQAKGQQVIVRTSSGLPDLATLGRIPVKLSMSGRPILVRDIASVREDHTQRLGAATSGGEEAVLGTALMYIGANSRQVALDVMSAIRELEVPPDVELSIVYTRSFLVNETIKTVTKSLAEGAALVVLVLLLLLGNFRAALAVAIAIPVSMLIAGLGMRYLGLSANLMSLGAIDFGLLVDASVVIIENLIRRLESQSNAAALNPRARLLFVRDSVMEVAKPVTLGLFIIMVVYVPILSLQGIEGKMFHPMAMTVLMALAASLVVALVLMPILGYLVLQPPKQNRAPTHSFLFRIIERAYAPALRWSMHHRRSVVAGTFLTAALSFFLFTRLGSDFVPQLDEGDLVAGLVREPSISLDRSVEEQEKAEALIASFPEVEKVFSRLGTPESATDPMGVNFADTFIILQKDKSRWPLIEGRRRTKEELMSAISERIQKELPGHEVSATQPIAMRFNEILEGSRADVSLRIFGPSLDSLIEMIDQAKEIVEKIPGVAEAEMDSLTALRRSPVLNIALDYGAMAKYGVNPQDANSTLMTAMSGTQIGNFFEVDRRFPIILHLAEELRENPAAIGRIPIDIDGGGSVPLRRIAKFEETSQVTTIARSYGKRYAALSIFLKGRDVGSFVTEAREKVASEVKLPENFRIDWGGQFKNLERARARLLLVIPITLILIFGLLLKMFKSVRLTLLVYSSVPLAVTGGIFALHLRGISFSVTAAVGFIALMGIAILNSVVLLDFISHLRERGASADAAAEEGALTRLRPVVMTALVAGLGFLPMALNTGMGAEVQRPLATVVIGGLITSTFLTLFVLPTLYAWLGSKEEVNTL